MGKKVIHSALEDSDPHAAGQHESPTDEPVAAPSANCFGRNAELPRQLVDRQQALVGRRGRLFDHWVQAIDAHGKSFALFQRETKKADVAEHPEVFDHVGLLSNEPLGTAGLLFI
jgi:hypothetical protein